MKTAFHLSKVEALNAVIAMPCTESTDVSAISKSILAAGQILLNNSRLYGWESEASSQLFSSVEIYAEQLELWQRVLELHGLSKDTEMPTNGLMAGVEKGVLLAVLPSRAKQIRPEYASSEDFWTRLLAHELAHRLHVEILHGDEDGMGPQWFFEGFAIVMSDQDLGFASPRVSANQAAALQSTKVKGRGSYARYAQALRFYMELCPLANLVQRARRPDFNDWIASL